MAQRVADQISGVLANSLLQERTRREAEERAALAEIGRAVNAELDLHAVFETMANAVGVMVPYDRLTVTSSSAESNEVETVFVDGIDVPGFGVGRTAEPAASSLEIERPREGVTLWSAGMGEIADGSPIAEAGLRSWLEVPLGNPDDPVGYLSLRSRDEEAYTEEHVDLLLAVSAQVSPAIRVARLLGELRTRMNELGALNQSFQKQLSEREEIRKQFQGLLDSVEQISQRSNEILSRATERMLPEGREGPGIEALRMARDRAADPLPSERAVAMGGLVMDPRARTATAAGTPMSLSPREYALLLELVRAGGSVVERTRLLRLVWGNQYWSETRYLTVYVARLRSKLRKHPVVRCTIETVRGVGYRLSETAEGTPA